MQDRVKMRLLDSNERKETFKEVALGYNKEEATNEASRCLNCKNPLCMQGCPVNTNIPEFINLVKQDKLEEAYEVITKQNGFPGICGRVCPQENQCEGKCIRGIKGESVAIGRLERYVADNHKKINENKIKKLNKSVGVIGSGPSGLAFASECLNNGFDVTIYEALHDFGGVLIYGIPEFRLPKTIVKQEVDNLINKGAILKNNVLVGKTITIEELLEKHDYLFVGVGAGIPRFMNIPGENLNGVMSANEFLTRINLMKCYTGISDTPLKKAKNVVVVGGGNVAMDAARSAKRTGANVSLVYRRTIEEMPARKEEIEHALEEDIKFYNLTNPYEIIGDETNNVCKINCNVMELGEPDESGRRSFKVIEGKITTIECDEVIMAIGNYSNPILKNTCDLIKFSDRGLIEVDENLKTSHDRIYAGGDIVTGAATVILAMGAAKKAASHIASIELAKNN